MAIKEHLVAERYARGLSAAIDDDAKLEPMLADLNELARLYRNEHGLRVFLANPTIDNRLREKALVEVLDKMDVTTEARRFSRVLLRRGRIGLLPTVAGVFASVVDERLNRVEAKVTTAVELNGEQVARLRRSLEAFSGATVRTTCVVDEDVLGGVVARLGSTVIDGSLRARLNQLKQTLLSEEM